jgi:hypothetical protein
MRLWMLFSGKVNREQKLGFGKVRQEWMHLCLLGGAQQCRTKWPQPRQLKQHADNVQLGDRWRDNERISPRTPSYTPAGGGAPYGSVTHGDASELRSYLKETCQHHTNHA